MSSSTIIKRVEEPHELWDKEESSRDVRLGTASFDIYIKPPRVE